jgi:hypothetical protein
LNNVNDIKFVLSECRRISKIGAQLVLTYNTDRTMNEFYSVLEELLIEKNMTAELGLMKEHVYQKRKPIEEYVGLLEKLGFNICDISENKFNYRFVDGTTMLNHFLIRLSFLESWKSVVPEQTRREIFSEIEKRLNIISSKEMFLTPTIPFLVIDAYWN